MTDFDYSVYYARFHDDTEAHAQDMADWTKRLIEPLVPSDRSGSVLDVGCGFGFALRALRDLGFHSIEGIEISTQQAERCRNAGFRVEVVSDTIAWLKERKGTFNCVLLLDVLEHVPVPVQIEFLRAVCECLRPGGRIVLTVPNANSILAPRYRYNDYTHHSSFTEHSLYFVLKNAGFSTVDIEASKGIGRFPRKVWTRGGRSAARRWIVRWCWLQVFKAELPWERLDEISFELNLKAVAIRT